MFFSWEIKNQNWINKHVILWNLILISFEYILDSYLNLINELIMLQIVWIQFNSLGNTIKQIYFEGHIEPILLGLLYLQSIHPFWILSIRSIFWYLYTNEHLTTCLCNCIFALLLFIQQISNGLIRKRIDEWLNIHCHSFFRIYSRNSFLKRLFFGSIE